MSMNNPVISVIVPFYKAETTLERCVESILNQSCPNLELLLIDDGSTDGSGEICRQFVERDRRVRYHYQENCGVSSARNLGIDLARGEYVCFVDSDDWLVEDTLAALYEAAEVNKADCVIPRMKAEYYSADGRYLRDVFFKDDFDRLIRAHELPDAFETLFRSWSCFSTCGRLYRTEVLKGNGIRFDTQVCVLEDLCFNLDAFEYMETIVHVSVLAYVYYVLNAEKYSFKRSYRSLMEGTKAVYHRLSAFLEERDMGFAQAYAGFLMSYWIQAIRVIEQSETEKSAQIRALKEIADDVREERLMERCDLGGVDTQYRVLFNTKSVLLFVAVSGLKRLKLKVRGHRRENR